MAGVVESTPAVVLRARPVRESDLVVVLLTATAGKVDTIARGARRSRKRFPGGLPVGARGEASIAVSAGKRGSMARLDGFAHTTDLSRLGRDLDLFAYANYLCELCDHLVTGTDPDPRLFAGLCAALESVTEQPQPAALRAYELDLMSALGLLPSLDSCGICGRTIALEGEARVPFDADRGGALCDIHAPEARGKLPASVLSLAADLAASGGEASERLSSASREHRRGLKNLCQALLRPHLRRPLRSTEFFAQIARGTPKGTAP